MTDFPTLLRVLTEGGVEFVIVGGFAATVHGASIPTADLDVVYGRDSANVERLVTLLAPYRPYLRGAPPGLPFQWERGTVERGLNFTLVTDLGALDLLGEITGGGGYPALLPHSQEITVFGVRCRCLGLDKLIEVKRAAGRPRDLQAVADLEALREERGKAR
jgi:predicted nucleotidyltransferase